MTCRGVTLRVRDVRLPRDIVLLHFDVACEKLWECDQAFAFDAHIRLERNDRDTHPLGERDHRGGWTVHYLNRDIACGPFARAPFFRGPYIVANKSPTQDGDHRSGPIVPDPKRGRGWLFLSVKMSLKSVLEMTPQGLSTRL